MVKKALKKNAATNPWADIISGKLPLSQSLISSFMQCPQQFMYTINRWEKPGRERDTFFGTVVHEILDYSYANNYVMTDDEIQEFMSSHINEGVASGDYAWLNTFERIYQETLILVVLSEYMDYYADEIKSMDVVETEQVFITQDTVTKIWLTGKRDLRYRRGGKNILRDHKTTAYMDEDKKLLSLGIDFQMLFYVHCLGLEGHTVDKFEHNMIRRPKYKPRQTERMTNFADRLRSEIRQNPAHFFFQVESEYDKDEMKDFELDLRMYLEWIRQAAQQLHNDQKVASALIRRNRSHCVGAFDCPYLEACASRSLSAYRQRAKVSPEL